MKSNEIVYVGGWNGGHFSHELKEGTPLILVADSGTTHDAVLVEKFKTYGQDYDMGHVYDWEFTDWYVQLPGDEFNRLTSLLGLLKKGEVLVFIDEDAMKGIK